MVPWETSVSKALLTLSAWAGGQEPRSSHPWPARLLVLTGAHESYIKDAGPQEKAGPREEKLETIPALSHPSYQPCDKWPVAVNVANPFKNSQALEELPPPQSQVQ